MKVKVRLAHMLLLLMPTTYGQQYPFLRATDSPPDAEGLFEDSRGRLWLGGSDASCFDGSRFFSLRQFGLPAGTTFGFVEDREGAIWVISATGLYRFQSGHLTRVINGVVLSAVSLGEILLASAGPPGRGIARNASLYRVVSQNGNWRAEELMSLGSQGRLTNDRNGMVIFPCAGGWCEIRDRDALNWRKPDDPALIRHSTVLPADDVKVLRDQFGCVWLRTEAVAEYQCPGDDTPKELPSDIASYGMAEGIHETQDGKILISSFGSLAIGRPGNFRVITPVNGLPPVSDAIAGEDGTIWLGGNKGLFRCPYPLQFEFWTEREGLVTPTSILRIGRRVFAGSYRGVYELSADRQRWVQLPHSNELGPVWSLLPGPDGTLFAALPRSGAALVRFDGTVVARSSLDPGHGGAKLVRTSDGQVWLSGKNVMRVLRSGHKLILEPQKLSEPNDNGLDMEFEPATGKLWACNSGGLAVRIGSSWRLITARDGLIQSACRALAADRNGDVWYSYNTVPAFALVHLADNDQVTIKQFRDGVDLEGARSDFFDVDSRGWLWRGGPSGVYVADPWAAKSGKWLHLDLDDGLPAVAATQQSFYSDPDGSVWWAADNTIVHFRPPADFLGSRRPPQIFISGLAWRNRSILADAASAIPYGNNVVGEVGSLQFDRRNALRLRYRLLPERPDWREQRALDLNLGTPSWDLHTLEVQGRLGTGSWSVAKSRRFLVARPYWLSWPFLGISSGLIIATACVASVWRTKRAAQAKRALPDLSELRMSILIPEIEQFYDGITDGRYRIGGVLERGGFATVLDAVDLERDGVRCAIKVFRQELMADPSTIRRFQQEVTALEKVRHPNVVSIYGHGRVGEGSPYLVMEFIEGKTLRDILEAGPLSANRTADFVRQLGQALSAIHATGIFHRDIKPDNIMIRSGMPRGQDLVLIDFSIALIRNTEAMLTGLSRAVGTKGYMAPEHSIGYADSTTDIYNFAKVVLEMLSAKPLPSALLEPSATSKSRVRDFIAQLPVSFDPRSVELIASALSFDPTQRPRDAGEFADRIAEDLVRVRLL